MTEPSPASEPSPDVHDAAVLEDLSDAVIIVDSSGTITFWNHAAVRVFGWTAAHAVGRSLDLIIPERQRPRHWEGFHEVMATGRSRYGTDLLRVPSLHADGRPRSIAFTVTLLSGPDGRPSGLVAVVRDETERRAEEQDLRRRLRELEAAGPA